MIPRTKEDDALLAWADVRIAGIVALGTDIGFKKRLSIQASSRCWISAGPLSLGVARAQPAGPAYINVDIVRHHADITFEHLTSKHPSRNIL